MTPIGQNLIETSLLTEPERKWVNDYHAEVWEKTSGFFKEDALTLSWLQRETQPLK